MADREFPTGSHHTSAQKYQTSRYEFLPKTELSQRVGVVLDEPSFSKLSILDAVHRHHVDVGLFVSWIDAVHILLVGTGEPHPDDYHISLGNEFLNLEM